ncbi:MAG: integrase core domain-containing protein [Mangrovibacterium sp.]
MEHRLTKACSPQTNGMVERVNGTIKNSTVLKTNYQNRNEMNEDLMQFLIYYNLNRRHGSLRKRIECENSFSGNTEMVCAKT